MPNAFRRFVLLMLATTLWACSDPMAPEPPQPPPGDLAPSGALAPLPSAPVTYTRGSVTLTDLGTFGGNEAEIFAVSNQGEAVGVYENPRDRGFIWSETDGSQDLNISADSAVTPYDINDYGVVSGYTDDGLCGIRWSREADFEYLQALDECGQAFGINNVGPNHRGQIVGGIFAPADGDTAFQVALWGTNDSLEVLGGEQANGLDINDSEIIIGHGLFPDGTFRCLVWKRDQGLMKTSDYAAGLDCAEAVSHRGQLAGWTEAGDGATTAAVWSSEGGIQQLGTLGGSSSGAFGVNELGEVVGWSRTSDNSLHAFYWKPGGTMVDLGTLPDGGASAALDINDDGLIVGRARDASGANHAVTWRVHEGVLELELRVEKTSFEPVLARCFDATTQVARIGTYCKQDADRLDRTAVEVIVQRDGQPVAGQDIRLRSVPIDGSGGHLHSSPPRPSGRFPSATGDTMVVVLTSDADGTDSITYQSSGISGRELIRAELLDSEGSPLDGEEQTKQATVTIAFTDARLDSMPREDEHYVFKRQGPRHGAKENHYVQPRARENLLRIFQDYFDEVAPEDRFQPDGRSPPSKFVVTDAGLRSGGLYDVGPELESPLPPWRNPHRFHRTGEDFDIRISNIPAGRARRTVERLCKLHQARCVDEGDHFHVFTDYARRRADRFGER